MKNILCAFVVALSPVSLIGVAQKPALVKDADANGRIPYITTIPWVCPIVNPGLCADHIYSFPQVPAGYRLAITYVSAQFIANLSDPKQLSVSLNNGQVSSDMHFAAIDLPPAVCTPNKPGSENNCVASGPVSFYVEPTLAPSVTVHTGDTTAYLDNNTRVTVVGYLISTN